MRSEPDKEMVALAKRLSVFRFTSPLPDETDHEIRNVRVKYGFKNCYLSFGRNPWSVKMYIGGKQRTLGVSADVVTAVRFADVALKEFWGDRSNTRRQITDGDLNISLDQASRDGVEAAVLIGDIRSHFINRGYILLGTEKINQDFRRALSADRLGVMNAFRSTLSLFLKHRVRFDSIPGSASMNKILDDKFDDLGKTLVSWGKIEL
jgi:hypothetical protein